MGVMQTKDGRYYVQYQIENKRSKRYFGRGNAAYLSASEFDQDLLTFRKASRPLRRDSLKNLSLKQFFARYRLIYKDPKNTIAIIFDLLMTEMGLPVRFKDLSELIESSNCRKKRGIPLNLRARVLARDNSTCQLCGAKPPEVKLNVDHIIPVSKGGLTESRNLHTLCESCNFGKSDNPIFK